MARSSIAQEVTAVLRSDSQMKMRVLLPDGFGNDSIGVNALRASVFQKLLSGSVLRTRGTNGKFLRIAHDNANI